MIYILYSLIAQDNNFIKEYKINASDITTATRKAKIQFGKDFNNIGKNVRVRLDEYDIKNHLNEILNKLMEV